jgi:SAM-dependent methyltransferase
LPFGRFAVKQTPIHDQHNPDLLALVPLTSRRLIEIGCSSGALARAFKQKVPESHYVGVEIDSGYAELATRHCDEVIVCDLDQADDVFWQTHEDRDCWIFGDTLEHLRDPWAVLRRIRRHIPSGGSVVVCIPNVQHWSIQAKLSVGDFRYRDSGLLDRTHLRWFTRQTVLEAFRETGFEVVTGKPRIFNEPNRERFLPIIEQMAQAAGGDAKQAVQDALALQYVIRAEAKVA